MIPSILIVIPARYASTRLPGKPLLELAGKPMIQHVYERAMAWGKAAAVVVATDDARIRDVVLGFGGQAEMTAGHHPSGTDRVAEVAARWQAAQWRAEIVINLQGDEPLLHPESIDHLATTLLADPSTVMATLAHPLGNLAEWLSSDVVKVVRDRQGHALYFSRAPIPFPRDHADSQTFPWPEGQAPAWRHIGLYAFRAEFLQTYARLPATPLEQVEKLEQLRVLEHGYRIKVGITPHPAIGVDTQEDLERVRGIMAGESEQRKCPQ